MRWRALVLFVLLAAISSFWACSDGRFQSPLSPLMPDAEPLAAPARGLVPLATASFWSSPWPWIIVGLVLFGGVAWGLARLFRQVEPWDR